MLIKTCQIVYFNYFVSVFSCFNTHKIVGKGWIKCAKILHYFKSSQNAPLRFKK